MAAWGCRSESSWSARALATRRCSTPPPGLKPDYTDVCIPNQERTPDDLRAANLPLRARTPSGPYQAVRHAHLAALEKARHPTGRVLDRDDRSVEPGPLLHAQMGVAR